MKKLVICVFFVWCLMSPLWGCSSQEHQLKKAEEVIYVYQEAINNHSVKKLLSISDEQDVMTYENPEMTQQEITSKLQKQFSNDIKIDNIVVNSSEMLDGFEQVYKETKPLLLSNAKKQLEDGEISKEKYNALKALLKPIDAAVMFNVTVSGTGVVRDIAALKKEVKEMEETMNLFVIHRDGKWVMDTTLMELIPYWISQSTANKCALIIYNAVNTAFSDMYMAEYDFGLLKLNSYFFTGTDFEKSRVIENPQTEYEVLETLLAKVYEQYPYVATLSDVGLKLTTDSDKFDGCSSCAVAREQGTKLLYGTYPHGIEESETVDSISSALEFSKPFK